MQKRENKKEKNDFREDSSGRKKPTGRLKRLWKGKEVREKWGKRSFRQESEGKTRFGGKEEVHGKRPSRMRKYS